MNNQKLKSDDVLSIDILKVFFLVLSQWKLLLFLLFFGIVIGAYQYINTEKSYKVSSLLQVIPSSSSLSDIASSPTTTQSSLEDVNYIYKSRSNILEAIKRLNLNIHYKGDQKLIINSFDINDIKPNQPKAFEIKFQTEKYSIFDEDNTLIATNKYDTLSSNEYFDIDISESNSDLKSIKLLIYNPQDFIDLVSSKISVVIKKNSRAFYLATSGLIEVSYIDTDIIRAEKTLNLLNNIYIDRKIDFASEKARSAVSFLDNQIDQLETRLKFDQNKLNIFQSKNKTLNLDLETETIIRNLSNLDIRISEIDLELSKVSNSYTLDNPLYNQLIQQKNELSNQKVDLNKKVTSLPISQQEFIDLYRNVEVSQKSLSNLLNLQLEYSILEASTLGDVDIIDAAYFDYITNPKISSIASYAFVFLLIGIFLAIYRGFYLLPIQNPASLLEDFDKKIFGVLPNSVNIDFGNPDEKIAQPISSIFYAINNHEIVDIQKDKAKVILFTSAIQNAGKSTISSLMAEQFASIGKTLLVDFDFKKGELHKKYEMNKISLGYFNNLSQENLEDLKIKDKLYLLPHISKLDDSFQFLLTELFRTKFEELKDYFDIIIIDTAPILSVVDTSLLLEYSDMNINIVRHNQTKINSIRQTLFLVEQSGNNIDGFIYNDFSKVGLNYYGYGYKYEYYSSKYKYYNYKYDEKN